VCSGPRLGECGLIEAVKVVEVEPRLVAASLVVAVGALVRVAVGVILCVEHDCSCCCRCCCLAVLGRLFGHFCH
jgi:hypothetical protein